VRGWFENVLEMSRKSKRQHRPRLLDLDAGVAVAGAGGADGQSRLQVEGPAGELDRIERIRRDRLLGAMPGELVGSSLNHSPSSARLKQCRTKEQLRFVKQDSAASVLVLPVARIRSGSSPAARNSSSGSIEQKAPTTFPPPSFHSRMAGFCRLAAASDRIRKAGARIGVSIDSPVSAAQDRPRPPYARGGSGGIVKID